MEDEREVTKIEAQDFAKEYKAIFYETSTKKRINVGKIFLQ